MAECSPLIGNERITCYANFDKYMMEEVVPWVPLRFSNAIDIVSKRIVHYQFDAFADQMSLDHVAVSGA